MTSKDITARNLLNRLGISKLLNTSGVTEVSINRPYELFFENSTGWHRIEDPELDHVKLLQLGNALAILNSKKLCHEFPIHSVTLPDGERGHIMLPPSCEANTIVFSFRIPSKSRFTFQSYIDSNRITHFKDMAETHAVGQTEVEIDGHQFRDVADRLKISHDVHLADWEWQMLKHKADRDLNSFFELAIKHQLNICMVGGTGSGKTAFTKAISDLIPNDTRIITIEDTHELDLPNHSNHIHTFYGEHITAQEVVASCMRLKPDRILLTELRGNEAWDYLAALNTGHPGGLTSVHANDALSVFFRIAQLAKESNTGRSMDYNYILNTVRSTIDIVCNFSKTHMTELYFDPVMKRKAMNGQMGY